MCYYEFDRYIYVGQSEATCLPEEEKLVRIATK